MGGTRLNGSVDKGFALGDFGLSKELDGEDAPRLDGEGGEDGGTVIQVASDQRDGRGEGGETGSTRGGWVSCHSVDRVGRGGVFRVRK